MNFNPNAYTEDLRANWDAVAPHYAQLSARLFSPITKAFAAFCAPRPGEKILDAACGPGTLTPALLAGCGKNGSVLGVDLAEGMLALARQTAPGAQFRAMNAEALDLPDASFDLVACQLGLMLFAEPEKALREFVRVLKPGGRLACLVQGTREGMKFTSVLMSAMAQRAPQLKTPGAPVLFAYGPEGVLPKALENAGLTRVRAERLNGVFDFASPQAYWDEMLKSAGRSGMLLRALDEPTRELVRGDVWTELEKFEKSGRLAVPYEVVMALGTKS